MYKKGFALNVGNNVGNYVKNYVEKDVGNRVGNYVLSYLDFRSHVGSYVPNFMFSNVISLVFPHVVSYVRIFYTYYMYLIHNSNFCTFEIFLWNISFPVFNDMISKIFMFQLFIYFMRNWVSFNELIMIVKMIKLLFPWTLLEQYVQGLPSN